MRIPHFLTLITLKLHAQKDIVQRDSTHLLAWSVLLYIIVLPFNTFGFVIPGVGYKIKYTELALLALIAAAIYAYRKKAIAIRKTQWLYGFIFLQAIAQFTSLVAARNPFEGLDIAVSVASYSVLVFFLVNVVQEKALLQRTLTVMGIISAGIAAISYWQSFHSSLKGVDYHASMSSESLLGNGVPHYLAYFLIMYGAGLAYCFLKKLEKRWLRRLLIVGILIWFYVILVSAVKIAHLAILVFLFSLIIVIKGSRLRAATLLLMFIAVFIYQIYRVPITNQYIILTYPVRERYIEPVKERFFAFEDRVFEWKRRRELAKLAVSQPSTKVQPSVEVALVNPLPPVPGLSEPTSPPPPPPKSEPAPAPELPPHEPAPAPTPKKESKISQALSAVPQSFSKRELSDELKSQLTSEYDAEGRILRRWKGAQLEDSKKIRLRGIAVGWLMGADSIWTGVGVGGTNRFSFDEYTNKVRAKAREASPSFLEQYFFTDEEILAAPADKGIFNIFLNAFAETGLPGLIAIVGILATVFFKGLCTLWRMRSMPGVYPIRILFPLFVALVLYHQTVYLWVHPWLWTIIALTYAAADIDIKAREHKNIKALS